MGAKEPEKEQVCGFLKQELKEKIETAIDLLFKKENCGYSVYEMGVCVGQIDFHIQEALPELAKEAGYKSPEEVQELLEQAKEEISQWVINHPSDNLSVIRSLLG